MKTKGALWHRLVDDAKRRILDHHLRAHGGHVTRTAAALGIGRPYLSRLIKDLQVPRVVMPR